jgi:hypothetical protein
MGYIIADASLQRALAGVVGPVEVRTSEGLVLGHYTPVVDAKQAALHAKYSHVFDLEEAERIAATEHEGRPLAEVWERIRGGEKQS